MLFAFILTFTSLKAKADGINTIKDAEIDLYIQTILNDVLISQNIPTDSVKMFLVADNSINAFVYDGTKVFVNLGLITASNSPEVIYGVLAHESGHIKGVHLVKTTTEITNNAIISGIIGLSSLALLATGGGNGVADLAQAGLLASGQVFNRNLLSFTRTQEREADGYALQSLRKMNISTDGVIELFTKLKKLQDKYVGSIDKYSVTHPLSEERIAYFKANEVIVDKSTSKDFSNLNLQHCLATAKINGFFNQKANLLSNTSFYNNPRCNLYYKIYLNIFKKDFKKALALAFEFSDKYSHIQNQEELKIKPQLNSFVYETIADIYFGLKDFLNAAKYYSLANSSYGHEEFVLKQNHAIFFDIAKINQSKQFVSNTDENRLTNAIKLTENIFDKTNDAQTKASAASMLSFGYRVFANITKNFQDEITSSLYLAVYETIIGKQEQAKQKLDIAKSQAKSKNQPLNQTNLYLINLIEQANDNKEK